MLASLRIKNHTIGAIQRSTTQIASGFAAPNQFGSAALLGINAQTGQPPAGMDPLRQSIRDILTTRIGTRVMRRDNGSRLTDDS